MKKPKLMKRLCPYCKKHTDHKVAAAKKKAGSSLSQGSKYRVMKRGRARGHGNHGRFSRAAITKWKMTGKKATKKTDFRYTCSVCNKAHMQKKGIRAKKVEFK